MLIDARKVARALDVSVRTIWRLNSAGKLPKPVRIQGSVRWDQDEIAKWVKAGAPDRFTWEQRNG